MDWTDRPHRPGVRRDQWGDWRVGSGTGPGRGGRARSALPPRGRDPQRLAAAHTRVDAAGPGKVVSEPVDVTHHDAAAAWVRGGRPRRWAVSTSW